MTGAIANRADVRYILESVWGTTPATPAMSLLRMTGESLNAGIQTEVSNEIRADRNDQDLIRLGQNAGGNVEFELSYGSFDTWIEAVLGGTWTTNVLVNGVIERSFSISKRFQDVSRYILFTGARINSMNLTMAASQIIKGTFGVMAKQGTSSGTGFAGATYPAGSTTTPMNGAAGITVNTIDAGAIPGGLMNFTLNATNNMREQEGLGSEAAVGIASGRFQVSGDFEVYFADGTLYDKFAASTSFALVVEATENSQSLSFNIPNAKFESAEIVAQGIDTDVMMKATYRGLYHSGTGGTLEITRVP